MSIYIYIYVIIFLRTPKSIHTATTCPIDIFWDRIATARCDSKWFYHCLYDSINSNSTFEFYQESCIKSPKKYIGVRFVWSGNLNAKVCQSNRYSPEPTWSNTLAGSECPFKKSSCNENGQITVGNGTSKKDRTCRCNYKLSYNYVVKPTNPCKCEPFKEDCSCYIHNCLSDSEILSQDYECIKKKTNSTTDFKCEEIHFQQDNVSCQVSDDMPQSDSTKSNTDYVSAKATCFIIILSISSSVVVVVVVSGLFLLYFEMKREKQNKNEFACSSDDTTPTFYIQHMSAGKFVQPSSGLKKPSNNNRLVLHKKNRGEAMVFTFEPHEKEWGYIVHRASNKAFHPNFGSLKPRNNKWLVLHVDRHAAALFAVDDTRNYIIHKSSGKFVHAYGGNSNPSDKTFLTLHSDKHEAMKFRLASPDNIKDVISVYPKTEVDGKWKLLNIIRNPKAGHEIQLPYTVGRVPRDPNIELIEWQLDIDCPEEVFKKYLSFNHIDVTSSTWDKSVEQQQTIRVSPGTTVATWQFQLIAKRFKRETIFNTNIIQDTESETEPSIPGSQISTNQN